MVRVIRWPRTACSTCLRTAYCCLTTRVTAVRCDSTNKDSFYNLNNWIDEIAKYTDKEVDKLILMNKCDLVEERVIDKSEINKFEKENGIKIMEVSAKTGDGVDKAFEYIIQKLIDNNEKKTSNTMTLQGGNVNNKQGCC